MSPQVELDPARHTLSATGATAAFSTRRRDITQVQPLLHPRRCMTKFLVSSTVALALAVPATAFSQATTPAPSAEPSLRTFFPDLVDDVRRLPSNPAAVSVTIGGILAASLSPLDEDLADWEPEGIFTNGTVLNGAVLAVVTLTTYGVAHWVGNSHVKHVTVDVLRAQLVSLGLTYGLKHAVGRERPDRSANDSFPSGHAAQTFASATVLARHLGPNATWPALVVATFVSLSRVNQNRHFLSDVVFGAGLGVAAGWNTAHRESDWTLTPRVSRSQVGINVTRAFSP
jgi:membrane-associated phospholipid phosphatase